MANALYERLRLICKLDYSISLSSFKDNDKLFVTVMKNVCDFREIAGILEGECTRKQKERNVKVVLDLWKMVSPRKASTKAKDILDASQKLVDLLQDFLHYYINRKAAEYKVEVKKENAIETFRNWINRILYPDMEVSNFVSDFANPMMYGALLEHTQRGLYPNWRSVTFAFKEETLSSMMQLAEDNLNIRKIIKPDVMLSGKADELTIVIYLSQFLELKELLISRFRSSPLPDRSDRAYEPVGTSMYYTVHSANRRTHNQQFRETTSVANAPDQRYTEVHRCYLHSSTSVDGEQEDMILRQPTDEASISQASNVVYANKTRKEDMPQSAGVRGRERIRTLYPTDDDNPESSRVAKSRSSIFPEQGSVDREVFSPSQPREPSHDFNRIWSQSHILPGSCQQHHDQKPIPFTITTNEEEFWSQMQRYGVVYERQLMESVAKGTLDIGPALGEGEFGEVRKGRLAHPKEGFQMCAVKSLKWNTATLKDVQDLLREAWIAKICNHKNVIQLRYFTFKDGLPCLLYPLYSNGDLQSYLRRNTPEPVMLCRFATDVTEGSRYLIERHYVHRDLAARNCLVTDELTVVLTDFGLSRDILAQNYTMRTQATIPFRSHALEILAGGREFGKETDIWSLGVLLWEIFSCGEQPYKHLRTRPEVLDFLSAGDRLDQPNSCTDDIYMIMEKCWDTDPQKRPSFDEILEVLRAAPTYDEID